MGGKTPGSGERKLAAAFGTFMTESVMICAKINCQRGGDGKVTGGATQSKSKAKGVCLMKKKIAETDEWGAYLVDDGSVIEIERISSDSHFIIPLQDIHNLWRLLGKVNGYLQAAKPVELAENSNSEYS
jgi:hypothetical protein